MKDNWSSFALLIVAIFAAFALFKWLPPQHNPLGPIDLTEPIGWGTYHKLTRTKKNADTCFSALDAGNVLYTRVDNSPAGERCRIENALTLNRSIHRYSGSLQMTCAQTAALHVWERQVLQPAAIEIMGSPVARIETYGSFSCRNIAGTRSLSQHAFANAIDISGIRLEDGRLVSVKQHWTAGGDEAKFLRRLHKGACRLFSVTLGPNYNAAHEDHFHFDMGSGSSCR